MTNIITEYLAMIKHQYLPVIYPDHEVWVVDKARVFCKLMVSDDMLHKLLCKANNLISYFFPLSSSLPTLPLPLTILPTMLCLMLSPSQQRAPVDRAKDDTDILV